MRVPPLHRHQAPFLHHHQKMFISMQNCQAYQVSHHSLSTSSLIQGIPTELAGGSREGEGGLLEIGIHYRFLFHLHPEQALCWAPFSTHVGKGLTRRFPREAAGPFFLPSSTPPPLLPSFSLLSQLCVLTLPVLCPIHLGLLSHFAGFILCRLTQFITTIIPDSSPSPMNVLTSS